VVREGQSLESDVALQNTKTTEEEKYLQELLDLYVV
jgi:hypothetical protein